MNYNKLKPLHGIIVVKMETQNKSKGGILLVNEKRLDHGTVVAVGPGELVKKGKKYEFRVPDVQVGDQVVIAPGSGVMLETEIDGEKEILTYMSENDISAKIRK
jgi:co-chaperonin GroES (HSP10)